MACIEVDLRNKEEVKIDRVKKELVDKGFEGWWKFNFKIATIFSKNRELKFIFL